MNRSMNRFDIQMNMQYQNLQLAPENRAFAPNGKDHLPLPTIVWGQTGYSF